jgi:integrase
MADVWKRAGRKSKPWVCDYLDASGRRHRIACDSKESAQLLLAEKTKEARDTGPTIRRPEMTVAEYAELWLRELPTTVKYSTLKTYRWALSKHILPTFRRTRLRDLTPGHVRMFLSEKHQAGLAKNTVRQLRSTLSAMIGLALADGGLVTKNAAKEVVMRHPRGEGSQEVEKERVLTESEVAAVIGTARDSQERALLMTLARTGCRPGEAMALQWSDPNFTQRKLRIERAIYDGVEGTTKTGKRRYVDISQQLAAALAGLYRDREKEKLAGKWAEIPDQIFVRANGSPLTIADVRRIFDRAARRAGISGHTTYDLRHTFASLLLAKNMPLTYVSAQLGHAKPTTTLLHYSHWIGFGDQQSFVDALDEPALAPLSGTTLENVAYSRGILPETQLSNS